MVFHCSLSDSKSPQVSRTLLSIMAVFNSAVVWMVSTRPPTIKSSSPFSNPLVIVPKAPITIGTIVTFMFHSFFNSLARSRYLSLFSHSFSFILWSAGTAKSTILQILFFLLIIIRSGLLAEIRRSVCMSKSHRSLCVLFSRTGAGLCIYHLLAWSDLNFLHISQWITLPTQSCLVLYPLCANWLHSFIMFRLTVSSLSPYSLHLLWCWVLSILALIWLVLMALSCAAIWRDSVSLLRFPFLSRVQVFWCEMVFVVWSGHKVVFFYFCFLVIVILSSIVLLVSFLMAVISPRSCFSMLSSSRCIDAWTLSSMLASPLLPSFLDAYGRSTSSLGCNALCRVISFLVLWSIFFYSSLVIIWKGSRISNEEYSLRIYSFGKVSAGEFCL